jgi:PKD repeat protein
MVTAVVLALSTAGVGVATQVQAAPATVHFTAAGDYDGTANTATVLAGIKAAAPQAHLALGDLSYGSTTSEQAWCDYVTARVGAGFPFELLSGNHESDGTLNGNINDFSACLPNQLPGVVGTYGRQWYVDYPRQEPTVRFVLISPGLTFPDGAWSYAAGTARDQWTAAAIDGARAAGIPWVVVGLHKPCLSVGRYACDGQDDINNLLVSKKVDLVLSGHEHSYQRTKQLALSGNCPQLTLNAYAPACVVGSGNAVTRGAGTVFVTVGTGGTPLRDVTTTDPEAPYFATWSGQNVNPAYGYLDVTADAANLTARFVPTTGSYTDTLTIAASTGGNQSPVATIASPSCTGLTCTFDGSSSSDPDGTVASYAWDFGDGQTGTGRTPSHTYPAAGSYSVTLTVTDNAGATGSTTASVTATAPPAAVTVVSDAFSRTVAAGFGSADVGGTWAVSGSSSNASVSGGAGKLVMRTAGSGQTATIPGTVATSRSDTTVTLSVDKAATGSGIYLSVLPRRVPGQGEYRAKLRLQTPSAVRVTLDRATSAGAETNILPVVTVPGITYAAGDRLLLRVQAIGTSPTMLRVKVWKAQTAEPTTWTASATDSTAGLQSAGTFGFTTYLSGTATNAPVTASLDDLKVIATEP